MKLSRIVGQEMIEDGRSKKRRTDFRSGKKYESTMTLSEYINWLDDTTRALNFAETDRKIADYKNIKF